MLQYILLNHISYIMLDHQSQIFVESFPEILKLLCIKAEDVMTPKILQCQLAKCLANLLIPLPVCREISLFCYYYLSSHRLSLVIGNNTLCHHQKSYKGFTPDSTVILTPALSPNYYEAETMKLIFEKY